jgi:hypothetical protein
MQSVAEKSQLFPAGSLNTAGAPKASLSTTTPVAGFRRRYFPAKMNQAMLFSA